MPGNVLGTYSPKDIVASISGPGGDFGIGAGEGIGEAGISIEALGPVGTMKVGADGTAMHVLVPGTGGKITVNLMKASPANAKLMKMMNYQRELSSRWGVSTLTVRNIATGDSIQCTGVAFEQDPALAYNSAGDDIVWTFNSASIARVLGTGTPEAA